MLQRKQKKLIKQSKDSLNILLVIIKVVETFSVIFFSNSNQSDQHVHQLKYF